MMSDIKKKFSIIELYNVLKNKIHVLFKLSLNKNLFFERENIFNEFIENYL
jgi:hypothetical protein